METHRRICFNHCPAGCGRFGQSFSVSEAWYGGFHRWGVAQNAWFIWENDIQLDDLRYPILGTSICMRMHVFKFCYILLMLVNCMHITIDCIKFGELIDWHVRHTQYIGTIWNKWDSMRIAAMSIADKFGASHMHFCSMMCCFPMGHPLRMEVSVSSWGYPEFHHPLWIGIFHCKQSGVLSFLGSLIYGTPLRWGIYR